jgi:hypothetical protein
LHQSKNALSDALGDTTGTFDHIGGLKTGPSNANLKFPKFQISYARKVGDGLSTLAGFGGTTEIYSGSFKVVKGQQDYDLQDIVESASNSGVDQAGIAVPFSGEVDSKRIYVTQVFYRSPRAMWRFYGYYGGVGVVGNYSTYGQFADDSTFEIIPTWQNKMQAIMYEDSIYTRTSHYAYELKNNVIRLFPNPSYWGFSTSERIWFKFYIKEDSTSEKSGYEDGTAGVNNMNTLPYDNIPYANINSIGKQWIRKYAMALCKEMLGQIRGKFTTIPIPGENVTLNHSELLAQAKDEQATLRDKLTEMLKEMEYSELIKRDSEKAEAAATTFKNSPLPIFVGWKRPATPPPPLFLGKKERDLVKQVNDELIEKVIGQQILYYPIDLERTNFHDLYGEAVEKTYLSPIRVYALVEWKTDITTYMESAGIDREWEIVVHFHRRRLEEDQNMYVREGDFILYGENYYEIVKLVENKQLFGQVDNMFEISAVCKRARKGLFDAS